MKYLDFSPNILSIALDLETSPSSGIIHLNLTLEAPCVAYCGVFSPTERVSRHAIRSQYHLDYAWSNEASISIDALTLSSIYHIHCMTATLDGMFEMSLASALDTQQVVRTPCCRKDLLVDVSSTLIPESRYLQDSMDVHFTLDSFIGNEVRIYVNVIPVSFFFLNQTAYLPLRRQLHGNETFIHTNNCTAGVVVDPPLISLAHDSAITHHNIRLSSKCPGTFHINISAYEFDINGTALVLPVSFCNGDIVTIVPLDVGDFNTVPPLLLTALFVLDGQEIELRFDSHTDMGGLGGVDFLCNLVVEFSGAPSTSCYWKSSTRMRIRHPGTLQVGDNITLLGDSVASEYAPAVYSSTATEAIGSAVLSIPVVVVSSPSYISNCDRFSLDLSASTGSGGREWSSVVVNVKTGLSPSVDPDTPLNTDVMQINDFFREHFDYSQGTSVPVGLLFPGQLYIFQITLCNFLGRCSRPFQHRLEVGSGAIPVVHVLGKEFRTVVRTDSVRFKAVPLTSCNGTVVSALDFKANYSPVYTWKMYNVLDESLPVLTVVRTGQYSSTLTLSPYSLNSDSDFKVVVSLSMTIEGKQHVSERMVYLSVSKGPLRAVLSTSDYVNVAFGEILSLNASESFDSDLGGKKDHSQLSSSVLVSWSCTLLDASKYAAGCGAVATVNNNKQTLFLNTTRGGYVDALYRIVLTVTSAAANDSRAATSVVHVFVEANCCTKLSFVPMTGLVNSQDVIRVGGLITTSLNGVARWTLLDSALDLDDIVMAPPAVNVFTFYPIATSIVTNLVIAPNSLSPGATYVFQLVYNSNNGQDVRSVKGTVTTNDIPASGFFSVHPLMGVELKDEFALSASQWSDEQLPLLYRFGYYTVSGEGETLKVKSEENRLVSVLPRGYSASVNSSLFLECLLEVFDQLGAYATRTQLVMVNASALNTSELDTLLEKLQNETVSDLDDSLVEEVRDVFVPVVVVSTNCSMAPNCSSLNRANCSEVENTCGACFAGNYLGEEGHANTFCYDNSGYDEGVDHCFEDASCGPFRECVDYICNRISQSCVDSCLTHGACAYRNTTTGLVVEDCFLDDIDCAPFCNCSVGFNGPTCDIPGEFFVNDIFLLYWSVGCWLCCSW